MVLELILSCLTLIVLVSAILIYRQLRQVERSIRGNTYQSMMEEAAAISCIFVDNPQLADLWTGIEHVGTKGQPKKVKQTWVMTMMMDFYENMYFHYEQGNIPEEIWKRWERHIISVFRDTKVKKQWSKAKSAYYKAFREFIDSAVA